MYDVRHSRAHGRPREPRERIRFDKQCRMHSTSAPVTNSMARSCALCMFWVGRKRMKRQKVPSGHPRSAVSSVLKHIIPNTHTPPGPRRLIKHPLSPPSGYQRAGRGKAGHLFGSPWTAGEVFVFGLGVSNHRGVVCFIFRVLPSEPTCREQVMTCFSAGRLRVVGHFVNSRVFCHCVV